MTVKDPGWNMTEDQLTDFYARWREWVVVASLRGAIIVSSPKHQGVFKDLMERLLEDPWWMVRHLEVAPMMFKVEVPEDVLLFWTEKGGLQSPPEFLGNTGFGRLNAAAPTRDGVRPWETAVPNGTLKRVTPDAEVPDDA